MPALDLYRQIIQTVLIPYTEIPYSHGDLICKPIFDESRDSYLLMTLGWDRKSRVHAVWFILTLLMAKFGCSEMKPKMV